MNDFVRFRVHDYTPWNNGIYIKHEPNQYKGHLVRRASGSVVVIRDELNIQLVDIVDA